MSELKLYRCNLCGNMFLVVADADVTPICCGENMEHLALYTVDAAYEKHVPVISVSRIPEVGKKVTVTIGEKEHPMTDSHFIERVVLKTCCGTYMKELHPGEKPQVEFLIGETEEVAAAYAYCNIHGLWKQTECRGGCFRRNL